MAKNRICPKCGQGVEIEIGHECEEDEPSVLDALEGMKFEITQKTHIVAVLEYPANDSAYVCFVDLNKFDKNNEVHEAYLEVLKLARKRAVGPLGYSSRDEETFTIDPDLMVMYENKEMEKVVVKPTRRKPLEVKEVLTIWGES